MSEINVGKLTLTGDGLKLPEVTSFPNGPGIGQLVWDSNEGLLKVWNGSEWVVTPGTVPHPVGNAGFNYTGNDVLWTVPDNVTKIRVKAWGGGGGGGGKSGWTDGGRGGGAGFAQGDIDVTPGNTYTIVIGAGGNPRDPSSTYGGGGEASNTWGPASGGGISGIFSGTGQVYSGASPQPGAQGRALVLAGGGGGGGANRSANTTNGGGGGGTTGNPGNSNYTNNNGRGGSASSGGASRTQGGTAMRGGSCNTSYGAGGGSGYYGGGAGYYQEPLDMGGGGGGSGFTGSGVQNAVLQTGTNGGGSGGASAQQSDPYNEGAGTGGGYDQAGSPGRVYISWPYPGG
jgi:hypothetical protein